MKQALLKLLSGLRDVVSFVLGLLADIMSKLKNWLDSLQIGS